MWVDTHVYHADHGNCAVMQTLKNPHQCGLISKLAAEFGNGHPTLHLNDRHDHPLQPFRPRRVHSAANANTILGWTGYRRSRSGMNGCQFNSQCFQNIEQVLAVDVRFSQIVSRTNDRLRLSAMKGVRPDRKTWNDVLQCPRK